MFLISCPILHVNKEDKKWKCLCKISSTTSPLTMASVININEFINIVNVQHFMSCLGVPPVAAALPWLFVSLHTAAGERHMLSYIICRNNNYIFRLKIEKARQLLTMFPVAGTLIFFLSSCFSPSPPPPSCGRNSTWSQRQSDGVVTVTTSPFRVNTLKKMK